MRACGVAESGGEVQLLELPEPPAPERGQVLLAVAAAGIAPWDPLPATGDRDDAPAALARVAAGAAGGAKLVISPACEA